MRKDEHVYVIHIASVEDTVWPEKSKELTKFREFKFSRSGFTNGSDAVVHRRVLDGPFLAAAERTHAAIVHDARRSRRPTPASAPEPSQVRTDTGGSRGEGLATSLDPMTLPRVE